MLLIAGAAPARLPRPAGAARHARGRAPPSAPVPAAAPRALPGPAHATAQLRWRATQRTARGCRTAAPACGRRTGVVSWVLFCRGLGCTGAACLSLASSRRSQISSRISRSSGSKATAAACPSPGAGGRYAMVVALNPRCQGVAIHEAMATCIRGCQPGLSRRRRSLPSPPPRPLSHSNTGKSSKAAPFKASRSLPWPDHRRFERAPSPTCRASRPACSTCRAGAGRAQPAAFPTTRPRPARPAPSSQGAAARMATAAGTRTCCRGRARRLYAAAAAAAVRRRLQQRWRPQRGRQRRTGPRPWKTAAPRAPSCAPVRSAASRRRCPPTYWRTSSSSTQRSRSWRGGWRRSGGWWWVEGVVCAADRLVGSAWRGLGGMATGSSWAGGLRGCRATADACLPTPLAPARHRQCPDCGRVLNKFGGLNSHYRDVHVRRRRSARPHPASTYAPGVDYLLDRIM